MLEGKKWRLIERRRGGSRAGFSRREWTRCESSLDCRNTKKVSLGWMHNAANEALDALIKGKALGKEGHQMRGPCPWREARESSFRPGLRER